MRSWLAILTLVAAGMVIPEAARAQPLAVDLEEEPAGEGPVTTGPMSSAAAEGMRLFDAQRWREAAHVLLRVMNGETGDDEGNQQIAQYHLAIALHRAHFDHASYQLFSEIADRPRHLRFDDTLLWLAKLAAQLPEPADVIARIGKYRSEQVVRLDNDEQRATYWQLNYLLGRHRYRIRDYDEAIRLFAKVGEGSKHHLEAQFWSGTAYVQIRRSIPAVKSFNRIVQAIDEDAPSGSEEARLRDLALLSMARAYYSGAIDLDGGASINAPRLSAAMKYWDRVGGVGSDPWLDAHFEKSWAYFMAGDYSRALGNIHTIQAPYFSKAFYPEAELLKALIAFTHCQYEYAGALSGGIRVKYGPIKREIEATLERFEGQGSEPQLFVFLKEVRDGKANVSPAARPAFEKALSDRQLLRHIAYVRLIDDETARFEAEPASLRGSALGVHIAEALTIARARAVHDAGALTRERCRRALRELRGIWVDSLKLSIDILEAQRDRLNQPIGSALSLAPRPRPAGMSAPDSKHVIWPFDGEYWRDEIGTYRQVVVSKCR